MVDKELKVNHAFLARLRDFVDALKERGQTLHVHPFVAQIRSSKGKIERFLQVDLTTIEVELDEMAKIRQAEEDESN